MSERTVENEKGLPKAVLVIIVLAVIAAVVFIVLGQRKKFEPVHAGVEAIDFTLPDLTGKPVSLKDYRGKVVFLNFWATWCKPCEEEMPSMEALYQGLKGQPFEIIAVSVDKDGPEAVANYVKKYGLSFTVLHDRRGAMKEAYKTTGVLLYIV
ncbi:MAG: redoxin domain-containing protein, partial [Deltaproteobacteria bacterium]|nr:redoxin domain-containing protein [Deltaproteobacteria bacterium]